jgi:RNA polymerase sigma-70 factor (ECF subfamily)
VEVVRVVESGDDSDGFCEFVGAVEPRLRRALVAAYGSEIGRDAAADALAWAWQHWDRVRVMDNPGGYLWRVGQTAVRRTTRRQRREVANDRLIELELVHDRERHVEPALAGALAALSPQQRAAVVLVHGHGYSLSEAADSLGCSISTLRNHVARALRRLHAALEGDDG